MNVVSSTPLYLLIRTVLGDTCFQHDHVQQSDYIFRWTHPLAAIYRTLLRRTTPTPKLNGHPALSKVTVTSVLR